MQFINKIIPPQLNKMYVYEPCGPYNELTTVDI